jgi:hypothetical protein
MVPETCRRIGKDLWEQVNSLRKNKTAEAVTATRAAGGVMQFDPGSSMSDRTGERKWR